MHGRFRVLNGARGRRRQPRYTQAPRHAIERAFASAQALRDGLLGVDSVAKAAMTFGVSPSYTAAWLTVLAAEDPKLVKAVLHGSVSLLAAATTARQRAKLLIALREATADDLAKVGEVVGVDHVFDRMIVPSL